MNTPDPNFQSAVDRAQELNFAEINPPAAMIASVIRTFVWPAFNRFARFNTDDKMANYDDFVRLCKAVAAMHPETPSAPEAAP